MINKILRSVSITLLVSVVFSISPASIASGETDNENFTPEQSVAETNLRTPGLEEILLNQVPQEIRDEISKAKETNPLEVLRRKIGDFSNNAKTDNRFLMWVGRWLEFPNPYRLRFCLNTEIVYEVQPHKFGFGLILDDWMR